MSTLLVWTNLPERAAAERLADMLIEKRLAACVNILAPCRSVYRWKGAVQHDEEHPMLIKTTAERYPALEQVSRVRSECADEQRKKDEQSFQALVSAATQARYAGNPLSIGTAMISGSSYGWPSRSTFSSCG